MVAGWLGPARLNAMGIDHRLFEGVLSAENSHVSEANLPRAFLRG
jgi:hypothetical protein